MSSKYDQALKVLNRNIVKYQQQVSHDKYKQFKKKYKHHLETMYQLSGLNCGYDNFCDFVYDNSILK